MQFFFNVVASIQTSPHSMEQALKEGQYIDYWQQDERYYCIRLKDVTDICDKVGSNYLLVYLHMC